MYKTFPSSYHINRNLLICTMSPSPQGYTAGSGASSFDDLNSTLSSPDPIYSASHRLRRRSNAALQMSDINSEPSSPSPLTPHLDVDMNRNGFFELFQSPTTSDTMLLTPNGSPTADNTWRADRPRRNMPPVGLGICDGRDRTEPDLLQVGTHLH